MGKDCFRHHDEWKFHFAWRNSNGEMDATCFGSSLGNGLWDWCPPSIMGGYSRSYPFRPSMGAVGRGWVSNGCDGKRERARGWFIVSNSPVPGDENKGVRREAGQQTWNSPIWYGSIPYRDRALSVERLGTAMSRKTWLMDNSTFTAVTYKPETRHGGRVD